MPTLLFERKGSTNILVSGGEGRTAARQNVLVTTDYRNVHRRWTAARSKKATNTAPPAFSLLIATYPAHPPAQSRFLQAEEQKARLRYSAAVPEALPPPTSPPPSSCSSVAGCGQRPRRLRGILQASARRCPPQGKPAAQQRREYTPLLRCKQNAHAPPRTLLLPACCLMPARQHISARS